MLARIAWVLLLIASLYAQQSPQQSHPTPPQPQPTASQAPVPQGYRIAGLVVNSLTGQPVPSASVAIAPITQGADREISKSVTTGTDGRFSFVALSRGKYSLMATARGSSLQYFDHHDPFATAIAVGLGLDTDHLVFRLQPDASIEGDITDDNNEPIQNAMVRLPGEYRGRTAEDRSDEPGSDRRSGTLSHWTPRAGHVLPVGLGAALVRAE